MTSTTKFSSKTLVMIGAVVGSLILVWLISSPSSSSTTDDIYSVTRAPTNLLHSDNDDLLATKRRAPPKRVTPTPLQGEEQKSLNSALPLTFKSLVVSLTENSLPSHWTSKFPRSQGGFSFAFDWNLYEAASIAQFKYFVQSAQKNASISLPEEVFPCTSSPDFANPNWSFKRINDIPTSLPRCMSTLPRALNAVKFYVSVALGRFANDFTLEKEYQIRRADVQSLDSFLLATSKVVSSHLVFASTILQTLIDAGLYNKAATNPQKSIIQLFLEATPSPSSPSQSAQKAKNLRTRFQVPWLTKNLDASLLPLLGDATELQSQLLKFRMQRPVEGRYWNMFRPFIYCSTAPRTCELPEGCRFVCNPEYLVSSTPVSKSSPREIVGIGSNNEFDWEASLIRLYKHSGTGAVPTFSIFDCTVPEFAPEKVTSYKEDLLPVIRENKFRLTPFCVGASWKTVVSSSSEIVRAGTYGRTEEDYLGKKETQFFPLSALTTVLQTVDNRTKTASFRNQKKRLIDILKLDAESFEFVAVPEWTRKSFAQLGKAFEENEGVAVDDTEILGYEIQQFQYELHRKGWIDLRAATAAGFFHTFALQLHLLAMGFSTFQGEKNHFGNCCWELAMVHHRFFVLSESKM